MYFDVYWVDRMTDEPIRRRARLADVARAAGVSTATADRVLHGRPGVRTATARKVLRAAAELDYLGDAAAQALLATPLRVAFLLPAGTNPFLRMLGDIVGISREQFAHYNARAHCRYIDGFDPQALAAALLREGARADGVAFMALEHPLVREAVNQLADRGVHTVTLISDLSSSRRAAYLGLDNRAAGRTAGLLLGRFAGARTGKVAMIAGSLSYRAHEEREMGFLHILEEMFPTLQVVGLREGHDDAELNYLAARSLLDQYPDLVGIYNIGGASDGVARALKEAGRDQGVVFIGHGLTPDTRALLVDGTMDAVITQNPQATVLNCVRIFANLRDGRSPMAGVDPMPISIVLRENLP